jgi:hypothetical protein
MSAELDYVKAEYPILALMRELQDALGYTYGVVRPEYPVDQKTLCVIHEEETESAKAYVRTNSVYCFTCGRSWDAPGLYAAFHEIPIHEAVRVLLARLGVAMGNLPSARPQLRETVAELGRISPGLDAGPWLAIVAAWCHENAPVHDHLDEVLDVVSLYEGSPIAEARAGVTHALKWATRVSIVRGLPPLPPPPVQHPEVSYLLG